MLLKLVPLSPFSNCWINPVTSSLARQRLSLLSLLSLTVLSVQEYCITLYLFLFEYCVSLQICTFEKMFVPVMKTPFVKGAKQIPPPKKKKKFCRSTIVLTAISQEVSAVTGIRNIDTVASRINRNRSQPFLAGDGSDFFLRLLLLRLDMNG